MQRQLPATWHPWRTRSALHGWRPTKADLAAAAGKQTRLDDLLPYPTDPQNAGLIRLLIVGTNPSPWAAAMQAPFSRPGNRFWKSLYVGGVTPELVNNSTGMSRDDESMLAHRGIGVTNIVSRPTVKSSDLSRSELRDGRDRIIRRVAILQPRVVAFTGVTAFRTAFKAPNAVLGRQPIDELVGWPAATQLWVVPDPSGLNAHETVTSLGAKWAAVWAAST